MILRSLIIRMLCYAQIHQLSHVQESHRDQQTSVRRQNRWHWWRRRRPHEATTSNRRASPSPSCQCRSASSCINVKWLNSLNMVIIVPGSASGITFIRRVCITAVYTVSNVADDDANSYIYYTFIILHYLVHISLLSCISPQLPSARALSLLSLPHFRGLHSVPLPPISLGYDRKPRPASGTRSRRAPVPF